jgi:glyoxylase-like metal-dependent hydrolase (beta-lactamase superfamily II)
MLKVERFVNELMTSNCYVVLDDDTKRCLVIDPGSEKSLNEITFIEDRNLILDYIILTHEHTDHNWGANALREYFKGSLLVCSESCNKNVKKTNRTYFLFYYDDPDYRYEITSADVLITKQSQTMVWGSHVIHYYLTPGHSYGSMCIEVEGLMFSGDTIMPYKPYFNGRDSNEDDWKISKEFLTKVIPIDTVVYPGHGEKIKFGSWIRQYNI